MPPERPAPSQSRWQENLATAFEVVADQLPDRVVLVQGEQRLTWRIFEQRAARVAGYLESVGVGEGDLVALVLPNGIAYLEVLWGLLKARATPINVNYRYLAAEMAAQFSDAVPRAVFALGAAVPEVLDALAVDEHGSVPVVAIGAAGPRDHGRVHTYEQPMTGAPAARQQRGDDRWMMFTGGTTGRPRAVVAPHSWLLHLLARMAFPLAGLPTPGSLDELRATLSGAGERPPVVCLPVPPFMHSTGLYAALSTLLCGGRVVLTQGPRYDPDEVSGLIAEHRVTTVTIVGDAFAVPLADAWDAAAQAGTPYDLSALRRISSVGMGWSAQTKVRLLRHADIVCRDQVSASEGGPFAVAETRRGDDPSTARFALAPHARLLDESGVEITPGSGRVGVLAAPSQPGVGYLDARGAGDTVFREIDGAPWVVPGDLAELDADGTLHLHGRGSQVINTGGEKVYADEVEDSVRRHPSVRDAVIVGVPDARWGHRVAAVVSLRPGAQLSLPELRAHVGVELAGYKRPVLLRVEPEIARKPSGKADLAWARRIAAQ